MALKVMGYNEATNLLASLRNVKRHLAYFNQLKLPMFEEYLDLCINEASLYRKYIKSDFKQKNGL